MDFTAIDFETANSSGASACSVGLVKVRDGRVVDRVHWYIRPPFPHNEFSEWNVRIHGITPEMVANADDWSLHLPALREFAGDDMLVAHNAGFDMGVIAKTSTALGLDVPDFRYLCSLQVARRTYHLESDGHGGLRDDAHVEARVVRDEQVVAGELAQDGQVHGPAGGIRHHLRRDAVDADVPFGELVVGERRPDVVMDPIDHAAVSNLHQTD